MTEFVRTRLPPSNKFLVDGWHICSDTPGTLCFICLKYLADVMGTKENKFQYWNNKLVSIMNYKFITAKLKSEQGFKKVFLGEDIYISSSVLLWAFLTKVHRNADPENLSNILICIL